MSLRGSVRDHLLLEITCTYLLYVHCLLLLVYCLYTMLGVVASHCTVLYIYIGLRPNRVELILHTTLVLLSWYQSLGILEFELLFIAFRSVLPCEACGVSQLSGSLIQSCQSRSFGGASLAAVRYFLEPRSNSSDPKKTQQSRNPQAASFPNQANKRGGGGILSGCDAAAVSRRRL